MANEKQKFEEEMKGATPSMIVKYLQVRNTELKAKVQKMQEKASKFVTIGDIEVEERP
jgi:hypothetical protein